MKVIRLARDTELNKWRSVKPLLFLQSLPNKQAQTQISWFYYLFKRYKRRLRRYREMLILFRVQLFRNSVIAFALSSDIFISISHLLFLLLLPSFSVRMTQEMLTSEILQIAVRVCEILFLNLKARWYRTKPARTCLYRVAV